MRKKRHNAVFCKCDARCYTALHYFLFALNTFGAIVRVFLMMVLVTVRLTRVLTTGRVVRSVGRGKTFVEEVVAANADAPPSIPAIAASAAAFKNIFFMCNTLISLLRPFIRYYALKKYLFHFRQWRSSPWANLIYHEHVFIELQPDEFHFRPNPS